MNYYTSDDPNGDQLIEGPSKIETKKDSPDFEIK